MKFNKAKQGAIGSFTQRSAVISSKSSITPYGNRRNNGLVIKPEEHEVDLMDVINKTNIFKNDDSDE